MFPTQIDAEQLASLRQRDTTTFKPPWLYDDRLAFCAPQDTAKTIVSGHTILRHPIMTDRRIFLDTGCGYGGPLTACLLPERLLTQVAFTKEVKGANSNGVPSWNS